PHVRCRAELEARPAGAAEVGGHGPDGSVDGAEHVERGPVDVAGSRVETVDQAVAGAEGRIEREVVGPVRQAWRGLRRLEVERGNGLATMAHAVHAETPVDPQDP